MKKYIKPILEIEELNIKLDIANTVSSGKINSFDTENILNDENIFNWEW